MSVISRILRVLYAIEDIFIMAAVGIATATVCVHVFFRYVLVNPLLGTEEIVRYLQITVTFVGLAVVTRRGAHINVSIFERIVKNESALNIKDICVEFIAICFTGILSYLSYKYFLLGFDAGASSALSIPLVLPYSTLFIGFTIATLHHIGRLVKDIIEFKVPRPGEQAS